MQSTDMCEQVVKLEAAGGTPTAAQNGTPGAAAPPAMQGAAKGVAGAKPATPQGLPGQLDAGKYMYSTKVRPRACTGQKDCCALGCAT